MGVTDWIWIRREFPWLGGGFIHAVDDAYAPAFEGDLVRLGFVLRVLDGHQMTDEAGFWDQLRSVFGFPSYFGSNWDAFHD